MGWMLVFALLGAVSCSREESLEASAPAEVQESSDPLGIQQGQWIDLGTLQTARETKRYALQLQREPDGNLTLAFLVSTDSGFQPATDLEGAELTLLVTEKGKASWSSHAIDLNRAPPSQPEQAWFRGRLPEAVRTLELTAVIPRLRIAGQRLHARFTMSVYPRDQE
jgi:hypothetical protein